MKPLPVFTHSYTSTEVSDGILGPGYWVGLDSSCCSPALNGSATYWLKVTTETASGSAGFSCQCRCKETGEPTARLSGQYVPIRCVWGCRVMREWTGQCGDVLGVHLGSSNDNKQSVWVTKNGSTLGKPSEVCGYDGKPPSVTRCLVPHCVVYSGAVHSSWVQL
eukprot:TRINITY_DN53779_c0_g1_i1.p1 TRINITY_DN53779_c0_g1~~TRINITY_DN53779_c0_g1_i1.p1  ORF type:complete len:164 (-),score=4.20 TRINITY_DN53779_c0_g1_i1:64-555(-)